MSKFKESKIRTKPPHKMIGINVPEDFHIYLKLLAIDRKISMSKMIVNALYEAFGDVPRDDDEEKEAKNKNTKVNLW